MAEPILKWAGGKRQLLDELFAHFPDDGYERYHEPFFGGGALFFSEEPDRGTINDTNERLVNCYRKVRNRPDDVIDRLENFRMPEADPDAGQEYASEENYYYQQRERFNRRPRNEGYPDTAKDEVEEAALLIYLNRTCFNGLYRENSSGEFNVPIGSYEHDEMDRPWVMPEKIQTASRVLQKLHPSDIRLGDFTYVVSEAREGDLVYFDPPYEPVSNTAEFTDYSAKGFDRDDQERLLEVATTLSDEGVSVVLSNSGVMADRYREAGFEVSIEGATRAINSDGTNRDEVDEIIATNVPPEDQRGSEQQRLADF